MYSTSIWCGVYVITCAFCFSFVHRSRTHACQEIYVANKFVFALLARARVVCMLKVELMAAILKLHLSRSIIATTHTHTEHTSYTPGPMTAITYLILCSRHVNRSI